MKKNREFKLLILLCVAIAIGGCSAINGSKRTTDRINNSENATNQVSELLKPISDYIQVHIEGKKQAVFYEPETKKIIIQAELTNTEITDLYAKFDENNINIVPIDSEFNGIMPNEKDNPFSP